MHAVFAHRLTFTLLLALLGGMLAPFAVPARPVSAAPVIQVIGTAAGNGDLTIPISSVAAGHSIIVGVSADNGFLAVPGEAVCSDTVNGTYPVEISQSNAVFSRVTICALHNVAATTASQITMTNLGNSLNVAIALDVAGLTTSPLDRTSGNNDSGNVSDSGATLTTNHDVELLLGVLSHVTGPIAALDNGTTTTCADTGTSSYTVTQLAQFPSSITYLLAEACLVSERDTFRARGVSPINNGWIATITTYAADVALPTVTASGGNATYTENGPAAAVDPGLTVTDTDSPVLTGATVTISTGYQGSEDTLQFTNQNGITGSLVGNTLTLTGNTTVANYQTALRSVTYTNTSEAPNTATRTVSFQVTDGGANASNVATRDITVVAADDPSTITTTAAALSYNENAGAVPIDPGLTVTDVDSVAGATVSISSNFQSAEDSLGFTNQLGIAGTYVPATGVLTLTGTTSAANYQTALRSVTYTNSSDAPDLSVRTVTFSIAPSASATRQINIVAANDPPTIASTGSALPYSENAGAVPIDPGLTVIDPDSTLTGAIVSISSNFQSAEDSLGFTNQLGIAGTYVPATGILTLTGNASPANYQTALRSVTYTNSSDAPNALARTITFSVNDGVAPAATATRQVTIVAANDPPINTVPGGQTTPGNTPRVFSAANSNAISVADLDAGGADIQMTLGVTNGTLNVGAAGTAPPLTGVTGNGTSTVTLVGSLAEINAAVNGLTYTPTSGFSGPATLTVTTSDLGNTGGAAQQDQDTTVITVGVLPTVSVNDPAAVPEGNSGSAATIAFTVTLSAQSALTVTVPYSTANGPAPTGAIGGATCAAGSDYLTTTGTVTFVPGDTSEQIAVPVCGDIVAEGNETLLLNLGTPTNATVADGQGAGTITDEDTPGITVSPTTGLVTTEAGGAAQFSVRLNTIPTEIVTIVIGSNDTTEGAIGPPNAIVLLTFQPDASALSPITVTVTGVQDAVADGNVAYTIITGATASADPNYNGLAVPDVALTNADDETVPTLSVNDPSAVTEGDTGTTTLTFTVTLTPPSAQAVTAQYATANGPAPNGATGGAACTAGVDYVTASGTLSYAPGESSKTVAVTVCADTLSEGPESLLVNLSSPTGGAVLGDSQGTGTIADDDTPGQVGMSQTSVSVAENAGSIGLTVQRDPAGTVSIAPGPARGAGPSVAPASGGAVPGGSIPGGSVRPGVGASPAASGSPVGPAALSAVRVSYATSNGTATAGEDYTAHAGTLNFGVGETTGTIVIPILPDARDELPETFTVTLSGPSDGATLGTSTTAIVTITDVDTTPCSTFLSQAIPAGTNVLPVISQAGCNVGDTVAIEPGTPNEEFGTILGFGSIVIQQQTTKVHPAGAAVVRVAGVHLQVGPPPSPGDDSADDERVERERETEEERRQRQRTNQGNRDDDATEGNVVETRCDRPWPSVVLANRDGQVEIMLLKDAQQACASIQVGDYLEADGEKQHEGLFYADNVEVRRR